MEQQIVYEAKNITKNFPGVKALDNVSVDIRKGEVHALVGENGAGKSTLMKILSGSYFQNEGQLIFEGKEVNFKNPKDAQNIGIAMIHQELSLSQHLSVAENIFQGRLLKNKFGFVNRKKMYKESIKYLSQIGVNNINPKTLIKELSASQMQLVEIAKALSLNAKVLIMDEPTASLTQGETSDLLKIIYELKNKGVSIIYISHKLEEIMDVADRITVFRDGKYIDTLNKNDTEIPEIISMMVGRNFDSDFKRNFIEDYSKTPVIMEVKNFNRGKKVKNVGFKLYKGEVLGITGLVGAGRTELIQAIFGSDKCDCGEVYINNKKCTIKSTTDAIKNGMALVPEGRKTQGLFLKMTVSENMTMAHMKSLKNKFKLISKSEQCKISEEYVKKLNIKTPSISQKIVNLSGGNQQKTIIARWLMNNPKILFLDEPTHGIDIGAKSEIYEMINELSKSGVSIVLISSELPEVLKLCDRVLVMHEGEVKGKLLNKEANQETIMHFATNQSKKIS